MTTVIVTIAVFVGVATLFVSLAVMFRVDHDTTVEDRLDLLTQSNRSARKEDGKKEATLLARPLDSEAKTFLEKVFTRFDKLQLLLDQAAVNISAYEFMLITLGLMSVGIAIPLTTGLHTGFSPVTAILVALLPLFVCLFKKRRRLAAFQKQLPDALELISRALRAGHSLAAGFKLVSDELSNPIGLEFGRVYEEQNLGIPFEKALDDLANRIPNVELRFFATAVALQHQTGGDLAEILDKIGHLVRERFKIWGAVQALTGEGRLSGIVLLALPPVLFGTIYRINSPYLEVLFTDELGKQLLIFAVVMQFIGALVIRKIVNIKV